MPLGEFIKLSTQYISPTSGEIDKGLKEAYEIVFPEVSTQYISPTSGEKTA
jgi:hypothetical protein